MSTAKMLSKLVRSAPIGVLYRVLALLALLALSPALRAQGPNQIAGLGFAASFQTPDLPTVFPGEVVTLFTAPLGVPDAVATQLPLPNSLSGVSVLVRVSGAMDATGYPTSLPIFRIDNLTRGQMLREPPALSLARCLCFALTVRLPWKFPSRRCARSPSTK